MVHKVYILLKEDRYNNRTLVLEVYDNLVAAERVAEQLNKPRTTGVFYYVEEHVENVGA
jgi:hypothetical protein